VLHVSLSPLLTRISMGDNSPAHSCVASALLEVVLTRQGILRKLCAEQVQADEERGGTGTCPVCLQRLRAAATRIDAGQRQAALRARSDVMMGKVAEEPWDGKWPPPSVRRLMEAYSEGVDGKEQEPGDELTTDACGCSCGKYAAALPCGHQLHSGCYCTMWSAGHKACPVCTVVPVPELSLSLTEGQVEGKK